MQRRLMVTEWNHKENLKQKNCHLPQMANDEGALAMMCGRDEEPWPNVVAHWRIITALAHYKVMEHFVYSKKQALRGLKKNVDDTW